MSDIIKCEILRWIGSNDCSARKNGRAKKLGYRVPKGLLTTDLLVTKSDGTLVAYSVKDKHSELNNNRVVFRQLIEKTYWDEENVEFHIVYKEDLDRTVCENILSCIRFYDIETVSERIGLVKHLIARKKIKVDLKEKINFEKLADIYIGKGMIHG